jgi:AcrR family transcriptional regulator
MKLKKTQVLIIESLLGLLEKHSFESLSVARITQEALVARNSFYRNFQSKEDILRTYVRMMIDEFSQTEQAKEAVKSISIYAMSLIFFTFFKDQAKFILLLKKNNLVSLFQDEFAQYLAPLIKYQSSRSRSSHGQSKKDSMYYVTFQAAGLCQVLVRWIEDLCGETEEEMARMLDGFVKF